MTRLLTLIALAVAAPRAGAFEPTANYAKRQVQGFTVLVHPEVEKHADEAKAAFEELDGQLKKVCAVVPEKPLTELKKVTFWVEWRTKKNGAMEVHWSRGWLKDNGYNPDKAGCVEINNLTNFVKWSREAQPWMVLHELAHAYHLHVLGEKYAPLEAAYKQAMERKLYDSVEYLGREKKKAYATTNPAEYFAELSEAYFGKNDFAPYTRAELEKHDPIGFELMKKAWGEPRK
ncbi:MAG: hypothetical protein J0I06_04480 [Planctomycetes bacterium]|nr:hypothetical protein [Planctomycetota bacterium]